MSTSSPAANRPLTQAVMAWLVSTPLALSAAGDMQVVELPLTLPSSCFSGSSLMSPDGTAVIGFLPNGKAGLWRIDSGVLEAGDFCPTAVNGLGNAVCGVNGDTSYVYESSTGKVEQIVPPAGQTFKAWAIDFAWHVSGKLSVPGVGELACIWTPSSGFQPIPGIPDGLHPSQAVTSTYQTYYSYVAGVLQGVTGKRGFVHERNFHNPTATYVLDGPGGTQSWILDLSRYGNRVVGQVPLPGELPWTAGIPNQACLWTLAPSGFGFTPSLLPHLPGTQRSEARGTSEWAEVIVGTSFGAGIGSRATVWASGVPLDLTRHLECAGVATPVLQVGRAVSDDGKTILASTGSQLYLVTGFTPTAYSPADLNMDGVTNGIDLAMLLTVWGNCSAPCDADINGDGFVEGTDLAELLSRWGSCS